MRALDKADAQHQVRCPNCGKLIVEAFEGLFLRFTCPRCHVTTYVGSPRPSMAVLST